MKILDYKNIKCDKISKKFNVLDEKLLSCNSLEEQKKTLYEYYSDSIVTRDELVMRKLSLIKKIRFDSTRTLFYYFDMYCALLIAFLNPFICIAIEYFITDQPLPVWISCVGSGVLCVCIVLLYYIFRYFILKSHREHYKMELPIEEIRVMEIKVLKQVLDSCLDEIDIANFLNN